jgi:hypothetical protein
MIKAWLLVVMLANGNVFNVDNISSEAECERLLAEIKTEMPIAGLYSGCYEVQKVK